MCINVNVYFAISPNTDINVYFFEMCILTIFLVFKLITDALKVQINDFGLVNLTS